MKWFVIISFFALSSSRAEAKTGYYYQQPQQSYIPDISSLQLQNNVGGSPYASIEHTLQYTHQQPQFPEQQQAHHTQSETYNKEFYSFQAPEEEFVDLSGLHQIQAAVQRNVRVIFIRTPENRALEHAALELAKLSTDDKTAIYVLNKQADIGDLANRLGALRVHMNHKPEVHFVKYRTPEEASHAQHIIQAQYDSRLPGQTQNFDEGIAPALNFVSKPIDNNANGYGNYFGPTTTTTTTTTDLNSLQSNFITPPQVATSFASGFGNFYGQTTDTDTFKNSYNNNFAIPQVAGGFQVGANIATPNLNAAGYGGYQGQAVDFNAFKDNFAANAAFKSDGFKENLGYASYVDGRSNFKTDAIGSINSGVSSGSSSFVFPTETPSKNTYLPSLQTQKRQRKLK